MEEGISSVWNFDYAEFYAIFQIKTRFVEKLLAWDLEGAYWSVRTLRMEIDAKLKRKETNKMLEEMQEEKAKKKGEVVQTEKEAVDEMMTTVDEQRNIFNSYPRATQQARTLYYRVLEAFYMELCLLMKKHQMYFREGEDSRLAILRR